MAGGTELDSETIGGLFGRLIEDGSNLLRAEINLQVQFLLERFREVRTGLILVVVALLLVQSSLVGLLVGCVLGLAIWIGPVGAGFVVTLGTLGLAGLLAWLGARQFSAAATARDATK